MTVDNSAAAWIQTDSVRRSGEISDWESPTTAGVAQLAGPNPVVRRRIPGCI